MWSGNHRSFLWLWNGIIWPWDLDEVVLKGALSYLASSGMVHARWHLKDDKSSRSWFDVPHFFWYYSGGWARSEFIRPGFNNRGKASCWADHPVRFSLEPHHLSCGSKGTDLDNLVKQLDLELDYYPGCDKCLSSLERHRRESPSIEWDIHFISIIRNWIFTSRFYDFVVPLWQVRRVWGLLHGCSGHPARRKEFVVVRSSERSGLIGYPVNISIIVRIKPN